MGKRNELKLQKITMELQIREIWKETDEETIKKTRRRENR